MKYAIIEIIPDKFEVGAVYLADSFEKAVNQAVEVAKENSEEKEEIIRADLQSFAKHETNDSWSVTIKDITEPEADFDEERRRDLTRPFALPEIKVKHQEHESILCFDDPMNEGEKVTVATIYGGIEPFDTETTAENLAAFLNSNQK